MSKLLGVIKESLYFSIAVSYLVMVILVDGVIRFVRSHPPHLDGYR
jgi:hypothetical protein